MDQTLARRRFLGRDAVLLIANLIGAAFYVIRASHAWVIPEEKAVGLHSTTGEPFVWAIAVFPIWMVFAVLNTYWGAIILSRRVWRSGSLWLLTSLIWLIAATIDFAHH